MEIKSYSYGNYDKVQGAEIGIFKRIIFLLKNIF